MKAIIFFIFFTIVTIPTVFGQIKIGDNPQNIDTSSVLELESTSKVLVITRVTTLEMEAITPQRGGMVYNTDTECINYYDGTQWVNLCDAVNFEITNDPIINGRSTIEITESAGGYNLEVAKNSILGDNIVDGGIGPDDIQDNSITQDKLAAESVGSSEIRQNAVGSEEIRDGSIAPADIANFIPGQVLTTDENGIVQWEDTDGLFDLTFNKLDTTLTIARSTIAGVSTISLEALIGSDDQQLSLDNNILSLENDEVDIDLSTYLQTLSINPAGTQISLTNGGTVTLPAAAAEVDGIVGNEILNAYDGTLVRYGGGTDTNPYTLDVNAGGIDTEELANNAVTNIKLADNSVRTANILNGTISTLDIAPAAAAPVNTQILTTSTAGVVGWIDIPEGTVNTDSQNLTLSGNTLAISGGNDVDLSTITTATSNLNDGFIFVGNAATTPTAVAVGGDVTMNNIGEFAIEDEAVTPIKIEPGLNGQFLSTVAGAVTWVAAPNGTGGGDDDQNASEVAFTPIGNTISTDVQNAIAELQTEIDGITVAGGETNTASNQGIAGVPTFIQKNGADLEFRSVNAGSNKITVTEDAVNNEILVDINDTNLTIRESQISDLTHTINTDNQIASAVPFTAVGNTTSTDVQAAIVEIQTEIDGITITGETNTASNQGIAGVPVFIQKNVADLEFRSVNAGSNKITVTEDAINNEILVDIVDTNLAISESQISDLTHTINTDNQIASAVPFTAVGNTVSTDVQAAIVEIQTEIDGITITGETNTASNQGIAGVPVFIQKNGVDLEFRSINAGSNKITVTEDAVNNEILVDINDTNLTITESQISDLTHTINTDNQIASAVPFTAVGNTVSTDVQAAIVEIQTEIDGLNAGDNLSNTNLIQTADRTYDLDENNLTFDITNSVLSFAGANSNVGIGNISPQDKLDVDGQIRARNGFAASNGSAGAPSLGFYNDSDTGIFRGNLVDYLRFSTDGEEAMIIDPTQNIGIGPTFATGTAVGARLHVDGDIIADGTISATAYITVPDYVFQKYFLGNSILNPNYEFSNLSEIEKFVKENNHLPGIKSAAAVKEQGFWDLGEASRVNLEKIEELFLHTIEQEKKIKELQSANTNMSTELEGLKAQMAEIKTMLLEKQND
ncbi:beta strand repeat-containing protein [Maribacter sp. IgM3_T14_3]|uniref:beta strand repeat-containing protein n=1 Tax=Maribacter sp. IgM3_T14_3 TaxID=3415140 RepID=UPI003C6ED9C1